MSRALSLPVILMVALAACGEASAPANPSVAQVKDCLRDAGLQVSGGESTPAGDDDDAPDVGELTIPNGTFIAFYSTEERADRSASELRTNANRLDGTTTRHGRITVLYAKVPGMSASTGTPDDQVEACV